jgi:hypothetical protein
LQACPCNDITNDNGHRCVGADWYDQYDDNKDSNNSGNNDNNYGFYRIVMPAPVTGGLRPFNLWLAALSWLGQPLLLQQKECRGGSCGSGGSGNLGTAPHGLC